MNAGELTFFLSGTTTPTNLFSDSGGTSIGTSILLNSAGYPESGGNVITLFRDTEIAYKIVLKLTAGGTTVFTADTLNSELTILGSTSANEGASLVAIEDSAGDFTAINVETALAELQSEKLTNVVEDLTPTLGGNLDSNDLEIQKANLKDYGVDHTTLVSSSGVIDFDCELSNSFDVALFESITTITLSNPSPSGVRCTINIVFVQDATGSWLVSGWPASVSWPSGTAPVMTATATTGTDMVSMTTYDGGLSWLANFAQDYS